MSFQLVRVALVATGATLLVVGVPARLHAQAGASSAAQPAAFGIVRGRVIESGSQRPVNEAQIQVVGTTIGAVTNAAGEYTLPRVPVGARTIRVRRIGFGAREVAVTVEAGAEARADVTISQAAAQLDQVVVTGTGTATTRRTLGNAVTQLDVAELTQRASVTNVTDVLQSRTPGVTLIPGSGTAGTAADIRIRGTSSLGGSNRPIFFIDGVRMYDGGAGNYGPSGAGTGGTFSQGVSALDAISPEDIESIEVIKGPAAATLYGADAAGGVVQIITKKGSRTNGRVQWNAKAEAGGSNWALGIDPNYTTCTKIRADSLITTGADAGKPLYPGCQGQVGQVISNNPLREDPNALRTGAFRNYAASARGGSDRYTFFVSGDFVLNEGVLLNNADERTGGRANFAYNVNDRLDFAFNGGYIRQRLSLPLGDDAGGGLVISGTRGKPGLALYSGFSTTNARGWRINLPEVANRYDNRLDSDRYTTGVTVNFRPVSWLRNRFTTGLDYYSPQASIYYAPGDVFSSDFPSGFLAQRTPQTRVMTFDYAGTASTRIPLLSDKFTSEFTLGAQGIKNRTRTVSASATGLPSSDFRLLQSATTVTATSDFSGQASLGYYVQEQIGYANRLFVTGALRRDDNSAFGTRLDGVTYPKASLSYVVSEEPALEAFFRAIRADNVKIRAAYGQAGRAPLPFSAQRTYGSVRVVNGNGSIVSGLQQGDPGNADLKPERGTETEYGLDMSFLDGRVGLELTGYNKRTTDALVSVSNAPSTGFTAARIINFGTIDNRGLEMGLRVTPVRARAVQWDAALNLSTNRNEMVKMNQQGVTQFIPFNPYAPTTFPTQLIRENSPIAGFWAVDAQRNADGTPRVVNNVLQIDTTLRYVGPAYPTYEGGLSNTVTLFGNLRLYALIDFKGGNYLLNQRERNRAQAANRNNRLFNDPSRPLTTADSLYWSNVNITAPWIEPADFVKLRDVSLSYTLPTALQRFGRFQNATLTVAAHNVGFLSKDYSGYDPEVNFFGQGALNFTGRSNFVGFVRTDSYTLPMMRRITGSVNVNF
jgi:TonB-linked SusC/RagA family outer membrane protein